MRSIERSMPVVPEGSWSSRGLKPEEGIRQWQDWAASTIAPIDVSVLDTDNFAAAWRSRSLGQIHMLHLVAPAQRVAHRGSELGAGRAVPSIQLVYSRRGRHDAHIGHRRFVVSEGEFILLDNTRFYELHMDAPHEAVDIMMPRQWIERWLPNWDLLLAKPFAARTGWAAPLGSLLEAMADDVDSSPLPRQMLAEQIGALLTVATGACDVQHSRHRSQLIQRVFRRIEQGFADPELSVEAVARELGISQRYVQVLLASSGTSFVHELTATRLDRAADLLIDRHSAGLPIAEIGFRCGFLDPAYFTRQFRRRFACAPRDWRQRHSQ